MQFATSRLATLPCPAPSAVFENPKAIVFGGTRGDQFTHGDVVTLGNGDGVIVIGAELTWWSSGTCRWRARVDGDLQLAAGAARVWARTHFDREDSSKPQIWSEIDASGRIDRSISVPPYVATVSSANDETLFVATHQYAQPTQIWRFDATGKRTLFATVELPANQWHYSMAARTDGSVAVLASTSGTSSISEQNDPRLILFTSIGARWFEVRLGTGEFTTNALSNEPTGWFVTLKPSFGAWLFVRLRGGGRILEARTEPAPGKPPGWVAGMVADDGAVIAGHRITLETWREEPSTPCHGLVCDRPQIRHAYAVYVLPP